MKEAREFPLAILLPRPLRRLAADADTGSSFLPGSFVSEAQDSWPLMSLFASSRSIGRPSFFSRRFSSLHEERNRCYGVRLCSFAGCATAEGMSNKTTCVVWNDPNRSTESVSTVTTNCCAVSPYGVNSSFSSTTIVVSDGSGCTVER